MYPWTNRHFSIEDQYVCFYECHEEDGQDAYDLYSVHLYAGEHLELNIHTYPDPNRGQISAFLVGDQEPYQQIIFHDEEEWTFNLTPSSPTTYKLIIVSRDSDAWDGMTYDINATLWWSSTIRDPNADYDGDGWLDLYASGYLAQVGDVAAEHLGQPHDALVPRLYRNDRDGTFTDVAASAEIDKIQYVMGSNYGDLDSDGYPDFYVGTGDPVPEAMMANRMFRNDAGQRFQEVTTSGGFGHFQKGHGVSFGDIDNDGDQDILVNMGGGYPADLGRNLLFENPGHGHHWVTLRLEGVASNRDGLGARVRLTVDMGGEAAEFHKLVDGGGSFGANSLQLEIGLGVAEGIREIAITWPTSGRTDVYADVEMDRVYRAIEGAAELEALTVPSFTLGSVR